ncbi:MAG: hypothetical protein A2Y67_02905 [Candidatus Buchananbacteria bacterium RBG_13_39_9]|uniref:Uncharacterized protein n=1 Tax=Candidatus Buchananbacteria bacterium RBG_13_39_9 TaxID=1797531 RepID=A0A1G1XPJ5_9BACT|nr:MAG: hypothetical protein A2Y67_02905 [Candidatus Buchananbacteria bacterium RBG_13_39_9]
MSSFSANQELFMVCAPSAVQCGSNVFNFDGELYRVKVVAKTPAEAHKWKSAGEKIASVNWADKEKPLFLGWV